MLYIPNIARTLNYGQPVNRASPLNRGLVSWWLNLPQRGKGNTFFDIAGANHGTLTNGPTWQGSIGRPGGFGSLYQTGASAHVTAATQLSGATAATWSFWMKTPVSSTEGWFCGNTAYNNSFFIGSSSSNRVQTYVSTELLITSGSDFELNRWHHIAVTFIGSGARAIYVDGVSKAASSPSTIASIPSHTAVEFRGVTSTFLGTLEIDDVCIFNRALTAGEVRARYDESRQGYPTTLNWYRRPVVDVPAAAGGGGTVIPALDQGMFTGGLSTLGGGII